MHWAMLQPAEKGAARRSGTGFSVQPGHLPKYLVGTVHTLGTEYSTCTYRRDVLVTYQFQLVYPSVNIQQSRLGSPIKSSLSGFKIRSSRLQKKSTRSRTEELNSEFLMAIIAQAYNQKGMSHQARPHRPRQCAELSLPNWE